MNKEFGLAKKGIHDCRMNVQKRWKQGEMLPKNNNKKKQKHCPGKQG